MKFIKTLFLCLSIFAANSLISMERPAAIPKPKKESSPQTSSAPLAMILAMPKVLADSLNSDALNQVKLLESLNKLNIAAAGHGANRSDLSKQQLTRELADYQAKIDALRESYAKVIAAHEAFLQTTRREWRHKAKRDKRKEKEAQGSTPIRTPYTFPQTDFTKGPI
ncbi:hypothetical protein BH09DEP1_BH09DEP1_0250 [soil metagenome]